MILRSIIVIASVLSISDVYAEVYKTNITVRENIFDPKNDWLFGVGQINGPANATLQVILEDTGLLWSGWYTLGDPALWYSVEAGAKFDKNYVLNNIPFGGRNNDILSLIKLEEKKPFYIGVRLECPWVSSTEKLPDHFGWMQLVYTGTSLVMLDRAIENTGHGIYIGTMNVVPEPSGFYLMIIAVTILGIVTIKKGLV